MPSRKQYIGQVGDRSVRITTGLAVAFEEFEKNLRSSMTKLVLQEMNEQLQDVRAAWPRPPSKMDLRYRESDIFFHNGELVVVPARYYKVKLKRTGRSLAGFKFERVIRNDELVFQINNTAKDEQGEAYAWYVRTYDLNMDDRKGKPTRAWHHFRRRALRMIEERVLAKYGKAIPKEL